MRRIGALMAYAETDSEAQGYFNAMTTEVCKWLRARDGAVAVLTAGAVERLQRMGLQGG